MRNADQILIVDDNATNRMKIRLAVQALGYEVDLAGSGKEAIEKLLTGEFDLVLLDIVMPGMSGHDVLKVMSQSENLRSIPVIVISAVEELTSVINAIELGAEDYLPKDFDPVLLAARMGASLEKKHLRDQVSQQLEITRDFFGKFVPEHIAEGVLQGMGHIEPLNKVATIMFTDLVGFTSIVEQTPPPLVAEMMGEYFEIVINQVTDFDGVVHQFLGDSIMVTFGLPLDDPDHATKAVKSAIGIHEKTEERTFAGVRLNTRIGLCTGEVFAGSVGTGDVLHYAIHGDAVNVAARLEQLNKEYKTRTLIAGSTAELVGEEFDLCRIDEVEIRGHTAMQVFEVRS